MGAPHTLRGESRVGSVSLNWKSPAEPKTMQWHNDVQYNGMAGISLNNELPSFYAASRFDKNDLKEYSGSVINAISFCNYSEVLGVTLLIYEDDKVVRRQKVYLKDLELKTMQTIALDEPYKIHDDVELTVAVEFLHGENLTFVAIIDRGPGIEGKGDLYSYDGINWKNAVKGNFLITAHIDIPISDNPDGYNVYRNEIRINADPVNEQSVLFKKEPKGVFKYSVAAVYGSKEEKSYPLSLTNVPIEDMRPIAVDVRSTVEGLNSIVTWKSPILADEKLTWSNGKPGQAMGGTSGSVRKIWAVNAYSSDEMVSYSDHQITAVNIMLNSAVTEMWLVIFENGEIVYSQKVPAEEVQNLEANKWLSFSLTTPYKIDPSVDLTYGYYVLHDSGLYPGKLDNGPAISGACYISTTTAKADFNSTVPSWTNIEKTGQSNWMLSADVSALGETKPPVVKDYTVLRDGKEVKTGIKDLTFTEELLPGTYKYTVVVNYSDGFTSNASVPTSTIVELPAEYVRPTFTETKFDEGKLSLKWEVFADLPSELKHHGDPKSKWGMTNEGKDVDIYIGAEFKKEDLALYADYEITGVNLFLAEEVKELRVLIYSDKKTLASKEVTSIKTGEMMNISFDEPVAVPTGQSIIVGYYVLFADGKAPIAVDSGPRKEGGDMLGLDGSTWLNCSRIDPSFNYNYVVGAQVRLKGSKENVKTLSKSTLKKNGFAYLNTINGISLLEFNAVTSFDVDRIVHAKAANTTKPEVKSYRIYNKGVLIAEVEKPEYATVLDYGSYEYAVSAVYTNSWESALSDNYKIDFKQPNLAPAPYGLSGVFDNKNLQLTWQSPESANELSYQDKKSGSKAIGLTRSSGVYGYFVISYDAAELANMIGKYITHIKFSLNDVNIETSSVVVFFDRNLIFKQEVDVNTLLVGENVIRLDKAIRIPEDREIRVGYYISHENGIKPNVTDEGPAIDGKGNLLTTDGTSWRTLKSMNKDLNYNWRISAVLKDSDQEISTRSESAETTYSLYIDGKLLKDKIGTTSYTVENAVVGAYTVTAIVSGVETGASNAVVVDSPTSIDKIENAMLVYYNRSLKKVVLPEEGAVNVYSVNGDLVKQIVKAQHVDLSELPTGVYIVRCVFVNNEQVIKVVK